MCQRFHSAGLIQNESVSGCEFWNSRKLLFQIPTFIHKKWCAINLPRFCYQNATQHHKTDFPEYKKTRIEEQGTKRPRFLNGSSWGWMSRCHSDRKDISWPPLWSRAAYTMGTSSSLSSHFPSRSDSALSCYDVGADRLLRSLPYRRERKLRPNLKRRNSI